MTQFLPQIFIFQRISLISIKDNYDGEFAKGSNKSNAGAG